MPPYTYTAVDAAGQASTGLLQADTRAAAMDQLARRGLAPTALHEQGPGEATPAAAAPAGPRVRVSAAQVEAFTRQLANLLGAGVPLSRALHILYRETSSAGARQVWTAVHDDVVGGAALADALARWPQVFPEVYVAMIRAGETGGFLDVVLTQIADFRARETELLGKVKAALVYPIVLATVAAAVLIFLLTYFIPRFTGIFAEFGASLPILTQVIVAASRLLREYGPYLLVAAVGGFFVLRRMIASDSGRRRTEHLLLGTPGLGVVLARFALVRFCRMLGTLLHAGVPLVTALRVARQAIGYQTLADAVDSGIEQVKRGSALSRSLAATPQLFPAAVSEMVAVAEEAGRLDQELLRLAKAYEEELDRRLRTLVSLAEPLLLIVMAGLIGTVVVGMLLPIFTLQELMK